MSSVLCYGMIPILVSNQQHKKYRYKMYIQECLTLYCQIKREE